MLAERAPLAHRQRGPAWGLESDTVSPCGLTVPTQGPALGPQGAGRLQGIARRVHGTRFALVKRLEEKP